MDDTVSHKLVCRAKNELEYNHASNHEHDLETG